ncbi:hypothetical protein [Microbacterium sp. A93]|uniref:hypothetical protein n=1 Tax=Microbacterium sp. A93 TaxID=3450716 RepID=UPI003F41C733
MPIHVRQLAEMFRKHGRKQDRNTSDVQNLDSADVTHPLQNAWRPDSKWEPNDVVDVGHGNRPHPSEYLDQSYIDQHLDRFQDGASRIYISSNLAEYGPGNNGTTFVFPTSELKTIIDETGGDARQLAIRLGMDPDYYLGADGLPVAVEIRNFAPSELSNLDIPRGNEGGANPQWIPGGYLPTGDPEAVISIPKSEPGHWPGTTQDLTLH